MLDAIRKTLEKVRSNKTLTDNTTVEHKNSYADLAKARNKKKPCNC